jgi:hypothetical protein
MCMLHIVAVADVIDFGAIGTVAGDWGCPGAPGPLRAGAFGWLLPSSPSRPADALIRSH